MKMKMMLLATLAVILAVSGCVSSPANITPPDINPSCYCVGIGMYVCQYSFMYPTSPDWSFDLKFPVNYGCKPADGWKATNEGSNTDMKVEERQWRFDGDNILVTVNNPWYWTGGGDKYFVGEVRLIAPSATPTPTPTPTQEGQCIDDSECSWCGDVCYHVSEKPSICPTLANPGYACGCFEGICDEEQVWECFDDYDCIGGTCNQQTHTCVYYNPTPTPTPNPTEPSRVIDWVIARTYDAVNWILAAIQSVIDWIIR